MGAFGGSSRSSMGAFGPLLSFNPTQPVSTMQRSRSVSISSSSQWYSGVKAMCRPRPGFNSHHRVMSAWMRANFSKYDSDLAPAVFMPEVNHRATFGVYNTWRAEMRREQGGSFDWKNVSASEARNLSEKMFDAARVPSVIRQEYWNSYERMKEALSK